MGRSVVKPEVIATRLGRLQEYLKILKGLRKHSQAEFVRNPLIRGSAERYLQLAIECCIDIGNHVISDEGLRKPQDYKDVFLILAEAKIVPLVFAKQRLVPMAGFRNRLVHDYLRLDPTEIHKILRTRLPDFQKFAKSFARFL